MEVIASIASVAQLLSQALTIIQKIQRARDTAQGYPKLLADHSQQLENLRRTLYLVAQEKELQTSSVVGQIGIVLQLAKELQELLDKISLEVGKSPIKKYMHALVTNSKQEQELGEILDRLDRAQADLATRIQLAHVGLTLRFGSSSEAALPIIQRIDQNVQKVLGSHLKIAAMVEAEREIMPEDQVLYLNEKDLKGIGVKAPTDTGQADRLYLENMSFDQARQVNGDLGAAAWQRAAKLEYRNNEARDDSMQINGNMDVESLMALLSLHNRK